jgi:hypothetical protein
MYSALRTDCAFYLSATHVSRLANPHLQCSVGGGVSDARAEKLCPLWALGRDDDEMVSSLKCYSALAWHAVFCWVCIAVLVPSFDCA